MRPRPRAESLDPPTPVLGRALVWKLVTVVVTTIVLVSLVRACVVLSTLLVAKVLMTLTLVVPGIPILLWTRSIWVLWVIVVVVSDTVR